jgi:uncharacterized membrane protein
MNNGEATKNAVTKKVGAFLLDKPVWAWWIFYIAVTGVLFGIFSLAFYLLTIQWWVGVLILLVTGLVWGSVTYFQMKGKIKAEEETDKIPA